MANEFTSKVVLSNGEVLIDLTQDDVRPEHVQKDIYFHDKTGARKQGTNTKTVDASNATAEAAEVLSGRTFGKGAEMQTGTMPDNSGNNVEITSKEGTSIPKGFYDGSSVAKLSEADLANLIPGNIKEGVNILGVEGDFGADDISSQSKEVTPSFVDQTINPDADITFLSSVTVKAIPVTRTDNNAGGVTVTIG
jgi:hypothetical protein